MKLIVALAAIALAGPIASAQIAIPDYLGPVHRVKNGASADDARRILGPPAAVVSFLGVEEWHYCAKLQPFRVVIVYVDNHSVLEKLDFTSDEGTCDWVAGRSGRDYDHRTPDKVKDVWASRAPMVILVTGSPLAAPVRLGTWNENQAFLTAVTRIDSRPPESLTSRPYFDLAMFWGYKWWGHDTRSIKAKEANQRGRFYPAAGSAPAVFVFIDDGGRWGAPARKAGVIHLVDEPALELIVKAGIPTATAAGTKGRGYGEGTQGYGRAR